MTERNSRTAQRWLVLAIIVTLVLFRSAVFVFWEQSFFDSDQAVFGLMAKHLAERRAFPVFMYGQNYLLAVESWLAAPLFLVAGASVATLKLPLVVMTVVVAWLLVRTFVRDSALQPSLALTATLPFLIPAPGTAAHLVEASGENLEPFLYVLLIWLTRSRPNWGGLILGVGFLNREFTIYGLIALLTIEAAHGTLLTRDGVRQRLAMLRVAAEVWLVILWLKQYSSAAGPGTSIADLRLQPDNVRELFNRICFDPATVLFGLKQTFTIHIPHLFGAVVQPVVDYAIDSQVQQGMPGAGILLAAVFLFAAGRVLMRLATDRRWSGEYDFCAYLVVVGLCSIAAYSAVRCGVLSAMRYELLSILGAVGLAAWYLRTERVRAVRVAWTLLLIAWALPAAVAHGRIWSEYLRHPPAGVKRTIAQQLEARGIRYASSDYWIAYYVTFLTNERTIVASDDYVRIPLYQNIVNQHRAESVRISRGRCDGGTAIMPGIYFCPRQP